MKETTNQKKHPNKGISSKTIGERRNYQKQNLQNVQKDRETQSKITNTRTRYSHPKRREHRKKQTEGWYIRKIISKREIKR